MRYTQIIRRPHSSKDLDDMLAEYLFGGVTADVDSGWEDHEVVECKEDNEPPTLRNPELVEFWRKHMKKYPEVRRSTPPVGIPAPKLPSK